MPRIYNWTSFWIFWGGGFAVFFLIVATNGYLITGAAPSGILDHQAAGNAKAVNAIQDSWVTAGVDGFARLSILADLVFITLYSIGGIIGGRLVWQKAMSPNLKKMGLLIIVAHLVFGLTDYGETVSQLIQMFNGGSDMLARFAAIMRPVKIVSFILATGMMIAALIWYKSERRA